MKEAGQLRLVSPGKLESHSHSKTSGYQGRSANNWLPLMQRAEDAGSLRDRRWLQVAFVESQFPHLREVGLHSAATLTAL